MQVEKEDYQFLFKIGIFRNLLSYCNNKQSFRKLSLSFNKVLPLLHSRISSPLINSIITLTNNIKAMDKASLAANKQELKKLCMQHKYAFDRLCDLFRVTQAITNTPSWYEVFINQGLKLVSQKTIIDPNGNNTGQLYCFENK